MSKTIGIAIAFFLIIRIIPITFLLLSVIYSALAYRSRKNKFIQTAIWINLVNLFLWTGIFFLQAKIGETIGGAFLSNSIPLLISIIGLIFVSKKKSKLEIVINE